jgi:hypothetical protein
MAMQMQRQCGTHRPMEHGQGFIRSHWTSPSGKCIHRIAPAAAMVAMVIDGGDTQNTTNTPLLASNYDTFYLAKVMIFVTRNGPLLTSSMQQAS